MSYLSFWTAPRAFVASTLPVSTATLWLKALSSKVLLPVTVAHFGCACIRSCVMFAFSLFLNLVLGIICLLFTCVLTLLTRPPLENKPPTATRTLMTASEIRIKFSSRKQVPLLRPVPCASRLCVCLDLDETCVYVTRHPNEAVANTNLMGTCETHLIKMKGLDSDILEVVMRPDVRLFLEHLSSIAEVIVFTAARAHYADAICSLLDPFQMHFSDVLSREHTLVVRRHVYVKDLSTLGRDLRRTILIDNSAYGCGISSLAMFASIRVRFFVACPRASVACRM